MNCNERVGFILANAITLASFFCITEYQTTDTSPKYKKIISARVN